MQRELSSLDLHFLCKELEVVWGSKVEKIYQLKEDFIFRLYKQGKKYHLRLNPQRIHLTYKPYSGPRTPPGYCTFLRKYVQSSTLVKIEQKGFDRVLVLTFSTKTGELQLVLELFGQGNLILCKEGQIMHPFFRQKFKDRSIQSKQEYVLPKLKPDIRKWSLEDFQNGLGDEDIGRFLAVNLGFGGFYSDEIVSSLKVKKSTSVKEVGAKKLKETLTQLFDLTINCVGDENNVYPFKPVTIQTTKEFPSFSHGLDVFFNFEVQDQTQKKSEKKQNKLDVMIAAQQKRVKGLEKDIQEFQKVGDKIYEHYADFQKVFSAYKELSLKEFEEEIKKYPGFISLDKKEKKLLLEVK